MPEDLSVTDQLFSAATYIWGTSLSQSKKTLSNYLRLLFPEIVYSDSCMLWTTEANAAACALDEPS